MPPGTRVPVIFLQEYVQNFVAIPLPETYQLKKLHAEQSLEKNLNYITLCHNFKMVC